jgi:hypothetical protein
MEGGDVPWSADIESLGEAVRVGALANAVKKSGVDIG